MITNLVQPANQPLLNPMEVEVVYSDSSGSNRDSSTWNFSFPDTEGTFLLVFYLAYDSGGDANGIWGIGDFPSLILNNTGEPESWFFDTNNTFWSLCGALYNPAQVRAAGGSASLVANYGITVEHRRLIVYQIKNATGYFSNLFFGSVPNPIETPSHLGGVWVMAGHQYNGSSSPNLTMGSANSRLVWEEDTNVDDKHDNIFGTDPSNRLITGVLSRGPESRNTSIPALTWSGDDNVNICGWRFSNLGGLYYTDWQVN